MSNVVNIDGGNSLPKGMILAVVAGNVFEWFDYIIYASLSYVLSKIFFPDSSQIYSLFIAMSVFSVSYLTRPIGSLVFGRLADKKGRKTALYVSGFLMAITSLAIAIIPTYNNIGILAPVALLLCRMILSFSIGGEFPSMVAYLVEQAPKHKKGLYGSFAQVTTTSGVILACLVMLLLHFFFSEKEIVIWAWRIPFGISVITLLCSLYWRKKLTESSVFKSLPKLINHNSKTQIKKSLGISVQIFFVVAAPAVCFYTYNVISGMQIRHLVYVSEVIKNTIPVVNSLLICIMMPLFGFLSDRLSSQKVMTLGLFLTVIFSVPIYKIILSGSIIIMIISQVIWALISAMVLAPLPSYLVRLTPAYSRVTVMGTAYSACLIIFGGFTPTIDLLLINDTGLQIAPGIYLAIIALISIIAIQGSVANNR